MMYEEKSLSSGESIKKLTAALSEIQGALVYHQYQLEALKTQGQAADIIEKRKKEEETVNYLSAQVESIETRIEMLYKMYP